MANTSCVQKPGQQSAEMTWPNSLRAFLIRQWDHRNGSMLRDFLVNEFVLNADTGLGNANISGL